MQKNSITRKDVLENMQDVIVRTVTEFDKPTTYVTVRMLNGFTIRESTTCVDPKNYDEETGKQICLKKIEDKIWFLLGYALQDKLHQSAAKKDPEEAEFAFFSHPAIVASESSYDGIGISYCGRVYEVNDTGNLKVKYSSTQTKQVKLKVCHSAPIKKEDLKIGRTYICLSEACEPIFRIENTAILKIYNSRGHKTPLIYHAGLDCWVQCTIDDLYEGMFAIYKVSRTI